VSTIPQFWGNIPEFARKTQAKIFEARSRGRLRRFGTLASSGNKIGQLSVGEHQLLALCSIGGNKFKTTTLWISLEKAYLCNRFSSKVG
jgi:hypothetical protein